MKRFKKKYLISTVAESLWESILYVKNKSSDQSHKSDKEYKIKRTETNSWKHLEEGAGA